MEADGDSVAHNSGAAMAGSLLSYEDEHGVNIMQVSFDDFEQWARESSPIYPETKDSFQELCYSLKGGEIDPEEAEKWYDAAHEEADPDG